MENSRFIPPPPKELKAKEGNGTFTPPPMPRPPLPPKPEQKSEVSAEEKVENVEQGLNEEREIPQKAEKQKKEKKPLNLIPFYWVGFVVSLAIFAVCVFFLVK